MINFSEAAVLYYGMMYIAGGILMLIISKYAARILMPYQIDKELVQKDNFAIGVTLSGYYAGVIIIFLGAVIGDSARDLNTVAAALAEVGCDLLYALLGILALNCCRKVVDKLILHKFSMVKEIITDRNVGAGAVEAGAMVATALIIAGAINGTGSFLSALAFFIIGQILLILFARFHALLTPYDDHDEIEKDNVAAGTYLGFSMVALGVIVLKATAGDFIGWTYNLSWFAAYAVLGFLSLAVLQKIIAMVFLSGACLEEEISRDCNLNVAWIGGILSIGIAAMIFFLL